MAHPDYHIWDELPRQSASPCCITVATLHHIILVHLKRLSSSPTRASTSTFQQVLVRLTMRGQIKCSTALLLSEYSRGLAQGILRGFRI